MATTYNDLYLNLRQRLRQSGVEAAMLEARELVCYAASKTREELARDARLYVPQSVEQRLDELVRRRLAGEPVAYLTGEWEFYGLPLDVDQRVLIPRTDTELLAQEAIAYLKTLKAPRLLDLCAGSGCVGLAVATHVRDCHVVLAELDEGALRICRQNVRRCGLTGRATPYQADVRQKPAMQLGEFACIVCNPPYIPDGDIAGLDPSVRDYEPHLALCGGADGLDFYRAVCERWRDCLCTGGRLYFEVGVGQADEVLRLMRRSGFGDLEIVPDTAGISRVVYGTRVEEKSAFPDRI